MKYGKASKKRGKIMLLFYGLFLLIWSGSILIMPMASAKKELTMIPMYVSGGCFWFGLLGTITTAVIINMFRKKNCKYKSKHHELNQIGLISFFKNKPAIVADVVMFVSIVCFIVAKIWIDNLYLLFICLAIFVFSFGMHCMLNGKNYFYLNYKVRREEEL